MNSYINVSGLKLQIKIKIIKVINLEHKDTKRYKGWKKLFYANTNQKKAGIGIPPVSDKLDFQEKMHY